MFSLSFSGLVRRRRQPARVVEDDSLAAFRVSASQWSVRLARQQAQEAAEFHRLAQGMAPDAVRDTDVRQGDRRAALAAFQRRVVYLLLGRRMQPTETSVTTSR